MKRSRLMHTDSRGSRNTRRLVGLALFLSACDRDEARVNEPVSASGSVSYTLREAAEDSVMRELSAVALTIAAGLHDEPQVRSRLASFLKSVDQHPAAVNLQDCNRPGLSADIAHAGTRRFASSAGEFCAFLQMYKGMALYMNPDLLKQWSGEAPVVTAISDPNQDRPDFFAGYRGDGTRVSLPGHSLPSMPVLVVLPMPVGPVYAPAPRTGVLPVYPQGEEPDAASSVPANSLRQSAPYVRQLRSYP